MFYIIRVNSGQWVSLNFIYDHREIYFWKISYIRHLVTNNWYYLSLIHLICKRVYSPEDLNIVAIDTRIRDAEMKPPSTNIVLVKSTCETGTRHIRARDQLERRMFFRTLLPLKDNREDNKEERWRWCCATSLTKQ